MWPFGRKAQPLNRTGPDRIALPVIRNDWKSLPPVQRAIGEHPLTAPSHAFADDLATHQDPSVVSRTLGHQLSIDAPAGLVLAVARPSTRDDGPAMVPRPRVQRRAASSAATDPEFSEEAQDVPDQAMSGLSSRELPVVAEPPAIQRLTTVAPEAEPVPIGPGRTIEIQRFGSAASGEEVTGQASAFVDDPEPAIAPRRTLGQSRRLGLGAPIDQVPMTSIQRATELSLASPRRQTAPVETATAINPAELAKPADKSPQVEVVASPAPSNAALAPIQRAMAMPLASPAPTREVAPERVHEAGLRMADASKPDATIGSPSHIVHQAAVDLPQDALGTPVQGLDLSLPSASASASTRELPGSLQRTVETAAPESVGISPRTIGLPLLQRRATGTYSPTSEGPTAPIGQAMTLAPAIDATPPASASVGQSRTTLLAPPARPGSLTTFVQRSERAAAAPSTSAMTSRDADVSHEAVLPVSAAARLYRSPDAGVASISHRTSDDAPAAAHPAEGGLIFQRAAGEARGTTAHSTDAASDRDAAQSSPLSLPLVPIATMASLQRATASIQAAALSPAIALPQADVTAAWPDRQETFFAQREVPSGSSAGAPSTPSAAAAEPAPQDEAMDALAGKLYDRIRSRLKSELLVDRERAGLLTDLR